MCKQCKLMAKGNGLAIIARKGAGAAADTVWLCLGECPGHMSPLRIYLALRSRGGR